jgi:hypothetical protein
MRKQFLLVVLCLCVPVFAFADGITRVAPSTWYVGAAEEYLQIAGSGLRGNVQTIVVFSGPAGVYEVEAQEGSDSTLIETWIPVPVLSVAGQYSITIRAVDDTGVRIIGPATMEVIQRPIEQPPLLSIPEAISVEATSGQGAIVNFQVSAIGYAPAQPTVTCDHQSGAQFPLGTTRVACTASDAYGNAGGSFLVTVSDTVAPVLTLPANITSQNPVVTYTASATDSIAGVVAVVCSPSSGATFPVGKTTVRCTAEDNDANFAVGTFLVTITTPDTPALTVPGDFTVEATSASGAVVSYSVSATLNASIACAPLSGTTFALGVGTVTCTATTSGGGQSTESFQVEVVDTTAPVLSLPATMNITNAGATGAIVNYTATATDAVDGSVYVACKPLSGTLFPLGTTTVRCTTSDSHANPSAGSFLVNVSRSLPPPTLVVPANITAEATSFAGAVVTFTVTSDSPFVCTPPSGSTFALGATTVSCTATNSGGSTTRSFTVTVVDTTPPQILAVVASQAYLWPADHKMVNVRFSVLTSDAADPAPQTRIVAVSSSDAPNGHGDGNTIIDYVITGLLTVELRAERSGNTVRLYTVTFETTDASGNVSRSTSVIRVEQAPSPRSRGVR